MMIDDERVRFYLRHREQLEEWQKLRGEAASAIDEWLTELGPEIEARVEDLSGDVQVVSATSDPAWPAFYIRRSAWPGKPGVDGDVMVGLQWARGKTLLGAGSSPSVGVRSSRDSSVGRALRSDDEVVRARRARKEKLVAWWVAYSDYPPLVSFPDQAKEYGDFLVETLVSEWKLYAPMIDRVIAATSVESLPQ